MMVHSGSALSGAAMAMVVVLVGLLLLIGLAIAIFVCWTFHSCLKRVPAEHRTRSPGLAWLLLIPLFNLVWAFFIVPAIAQSYQNYFKAQGRTDVGDCGYGIGLAYCICSAVSIVPLLNYLTGIAALVLLILFLVKAFTLRNMIPQTI